MDKRILEFFRKAEQYVKNNKEYSDKLLEKESLKFENQRAIDFRNLFFYVALNSGFGNRNGTKIYQRFIDSGLDLNVIKNFPSQKKNAIVQAITDYENGLKH